MNQSNHLQDTSHGTARAARDISHAAAEAVESIAQPIIDAGKLNTEESAALKQKVGNVLREQFDRVSRGAQDAYRAAKRSGLEWEEAAQNTIRRTPITTVLVATGVGVILGYALGRTHGRDY